MQAKLSGNSCPPPGSVPHGNWTCKEQEIPIIGTSFLDENAQTYLGKQDQQIIYQKYSSFKRGFLALKPFFWGSICGPILVWFGLNIGLGPQSIKHDNVLSEK